MKHSEAFTSMTSRPNCTFQDQNLIMQVHFHRLVILEFQARFTDRWFRYPCYFHRLVILMNNITITHRLFWQRRLESPIGCFKLLHYFHRSVIVTGPSAGTDIMNINEWLVKNQKPALKQSKVDVGLSQMNWRAVAHCFTDTKHSSLKLP